MTLKLEIEINSNNPDELMQFCKLIREGWELASIGEPTGDRLDKDFLFLLIRD